MRIYAKTTKLCIFALKIQQHPNTPPSMQAQLKLSEETKHHAAFCGLCFQFPSPLIIYSNLWICWGKFLEYFISYYWYIIEHTQNWKHSHRFPQWNSTKTKNLCKMHHKYICPYQSIPSDNLVWILAKRSVPKYLNIILYHKICLRQCSIKISLHSHVLYLGRNYHNQDGFHLRPLYCTVHTFRNTELTLQIQFIQFEFFFWN